MERKQKRWNIVRTDQFTSVPIFIDLCIGVLQGDTLAPYLFVIVVDYVMRVALADLEDNE
jgi:hypothetical protein